MKRIHPVGKSDACLENSDPTLEDSGFFGTPGARSQWDWSEDRRVSGSTKLHLWQTPARYNRNKWKGRASFVEDESSPWMRKLGPQHVLKGLIVLVILASLGFAVLTYSRHVRGAVPGTVNGTYKSIEFGRVRRSAQLEEEGKLIKDIVDDELGGMNAALQSGLDVTSVSGESNSLGDPSSDGSITTGFTQTARVWLYEKNVYKLQKFPVPTEFKHWAIVAEYALQKFPVPTEFKHWAIVAEYLDEDGNVDRSELYEAGQEEGFVIASHKAFSESLAKKWMKETGADRKILATDILNQDAAILFCSEVTKRKDRYSWNEQNCQKFVNEFTERFNAGKLSLPPNAEQSSPGQCKRFSKRVS